ncbi:MAG: C25 family peptidase propeptide domain-containing protein, partial [Candidatus Cloacimonadaceae bacterium]
MNFKFQAKILLLLAVILTAAFALSAQSRQVELSPNPNRAALRNNSDLGFDVNYQVGELKIMEVQTKEGTFDELSIEGWGFSTEVGEPKLPMLRRMISVPLGAEVRFTLNTQQMREMDSKANTLKNRIIPAQEPISKSADPATIPFVVNEALYRKNSFNTREWVEVSEMGIMRGV